MADFVTVDARACEAVIATLRGHEIPEDREDSTLPHIPLELVPNFYFYLVAICHQTSPRNHAPVEGVVRGQHRRGWDFLYARLEEASAGHVGLLEPTYWTQESEDSFGQLFTDERYGLRLVDIPRRVELVRDLGTVLLREQSNSITSIYRRCRGHLLAHSPNLLDELAKFQAYADPVQKKAIFFLSIMRNTGLWSFPDNNLLEAPVDYHEVRGHLRLGTVQISDARLVDRIRQGTPVSGSEDIAIRMATRTAIRYISDRLSITPSRAHYLFWNLFRSICTRANPQCLGLAADNPLPSRYVHLASIGGPPPRCPFAAVCPSAYLSERFVEHVFETDYY